MLRGHLFKNRFFQSSGFQGLFTRSLLFLSFIFFFSLLFLACTPKKKSSKPPAIPTYQIVFDFGDGIDSISFTEKKGSALSDQQIEQVQKQQVKQGHTFNQWRDLDDDDISLNDIRFDGDQTFTAGWNINKYKVTFVMNGATSAINQKSIAYQSKVTEPDKPNRRGMTFVNWYKEDSLDNVFDFSTETITKDITIYAGWGYTVTFNGDGATAGTPANIVVLPNDKITKPGKPTKTGETFVNWYKDVSLNNVFNFSTEKIENHTTIYAGWGYTITFNNNGATSGAAGSVKILNGKTVNITEPKKPSKTGMTFINWYKDVSLNTVFDFSTETVNKGTTIYAGWGYQVTFVNNGATSDAAANVNIVTGKKVIAPKKPSKTGETFINWYKDVSLDTVFNFNTETISADTTLYAGWGHIVTFSAVAGYGQSTQKVFTGKKASAKTGRKSYPLAKGHNYYLKLYWFKDSGLTQFFDFDKETIMGAITLYGKFGALVEFDSDPATSAAVVNISTSVQLGALIYTGTIAKPTDPVKANQIFYGWFTDKTYRTKASFGSQSFAEEKISGNRYVKSKKFYAKWADHKVTFEVNGGTAIAPQGVLSGGKVKEPTAPTKTDGTLFAGWYKDISLNTAFDFSTDTITKDTTLYAGWGVTVTFKDGGKDVSSQAVLPGKKAANPGPIVKQEYNFVGYFSDERLTTPFDFDTVINSDLTVYTKYEELMVKYQGSMVTGLADAYKATGDKGKTNIILTIPQKINGVQITDICNNDAGIVTNIDGSVTFLYIKFRLYDYKDTVHKFHNIVKVVLPEGIKRINYGAFSSSYITNINIPSSVTTIEGNSLIFTKTTIGGKPVTVDIKCDPTTPPVIPKGTFNQFAPYKVSVPGASVAAYQRARNWSDYHNFQASFSIVAQK